MFYGGPTIAINGFSMVFGLATIAFNGFRWFWTIDQTMRWFRWIVVVYVVDLMESNNQVLFFRLLDFNQATFICLIVWATAKQSWSPEQTTQTRVFQLPLCLDG